MADLGESSNSTLNDAKGKPVIVRVKRKLAQACLNGFWLEINERPLKRPLLDFSNLSISESNGKEELKTKKLLVQHVETVSRSDAIKDILQSTVPSSMEFRRKIEERRCMFKQESKTEQLHSISRQKHEDLIKSARFEQIWKSRRGNKDTTQDDHLHEMCYVYDVVRVDVEEETSQKMEEDTNMEDKEILCNYLSLMREFLPTAAAEIESDLKDYISNQDDYVYDVYAVEEDSNRIDEDALNAYPLVQVDADDDFYDGPMQSDCDTDDSNAEDNPLNDYPDEESYESGDESRSSRNRSEDADYEEEEDTTDDDDEDWRFEHQDQAEDADHLSEEESVDDEVEDDP